MNTKVWYTSKTVQGAVTSLVALLVNVFFAKEFEAAGISSEEFATSILTVISVLATLWSIFGRFVATEKLVVKPVQVITEKTP